MWPRYFLSMSLFKKKIRLEVSEVIPNVRFSGMQRILDGYSQLGFTSSSY